MSRFPEALSPIHQRFYRCAGIVTLLVAPLVSLAAPYVPTNDAVVLEVLPARQQDPELRDAHQLRREFATLPAHAGARRVELAAGVAERYYRLAVRRGDPRYVGYAQAILTDWPYPRPAPRPIRLVRALTAQFLHDFPAAADDLNAVLAEDPANLEALSYRAILALVQGRFDDARADCTAMTAQIGEGRDLVVDACLPAVLSVTGGAREADRRLQAALAQHDAADASARLWVLTRLGETARRQNDDSRARTYFAAALALGITDQYLLASYAELLLDHRDFQGVIDLLSPHTANDVLLLRLALAARHAGHPDAARFEQTLRDRIEAARQRGDELHLADEARFVLQFDGDAPQAVTLAARNWALGQREASDAEILMQAALAARQPQSAQVALDWLSRSGHEGPALRQLARQLQAMRP